MLVCFWFFDTEMNGSIQEPKEMITPLLRKALTKQGNDLRQKQTSHK